MGQSFFIWKGRDCRSMGVWMRNAAEITRPQERTSHIELPGRSGDLTMIEGEDIFNSYIQTVGILVKGGYRAREVFSWLRGADYVTFSGEPDRKQKARIIGAINLSKTSHNADWWQGEVQFYCQPLKESLREEPVTITASGATVRNNGDVTAKPIWTVTASAATVVITAGGKTLTLTDYTPGTKAIIDSENMMVLKEDRTADWTRWSSGEFPVLTPGNNTITGSGWSSLVIEKRERFL